MSFSQNVVRVVNKTLEELAIDTSARTARARVHLSAQAKTPSASVQTLFGFQAYQQFLQALLICEKHHGYGENPCCNCRNSLSLDDFIAHVHFKTPPSARVR